jgi:hypothetical protein
MRMTWVIVGIGFAFLTGNAWAKPSVAYRTLEQICLFSPTLSPAESPVGIQILGQPYSVAFGYRDDFRYIRQDLGWSIFRGSKSDVVAAVTPLRGIEEFGGGWRLAINDLNLDRVIENDWTTYGLRNGGTSVDSKPTFMFSGVPATGVENNGFVAGFRFKY